MQRFFDKFFPLVLILGCIGWSFLCAAYYNSSWYNGWNDPTYEDLPYLVSPFEVVCGRLEESGIDCDEEGESDVVEYGSLDFTVFITVFIFEIPSDEAESRSVFEESTEWVQEFGCVMHMNVCMMGAGLRLELPWVVHRVHWAALHDPAGWPDEQGHGLNQEDYRRTHGDGFAQELREAYDADLVTVQQIREDAGLAGVSWHQLTREERCAIPAWSALCHIAKAGGSHGPRAKMGMSSPYIMPVPAGLEYDVLDCGPGDEEVHLLIEEGARCVDDYYQ